MVDLATSALAQVQLTMSSWDAYITTNLIGSQAVTCAGIYDLAGNPWAYSDGFAVSSRVLVPECHAWRVFSARRSRLAAWPFRCAGSSR